MSSDLEDFQTATAQPQSTLGSFTVPNNGSNNATVGVPAGTHAVGLTVDAGGLTALQVQGVTSGINYLSLTFSTSFLAGYFVAPVLSVIDTQVKVIGTTNPGSGPTMVRMAAILDAEAVFVFDNQQEPAAVTLPDTETSSRAARPAGQAMQGVIPEVPTGTWTNSNVGVSASANTVTAVLAANPARRGVILFSKAVALVQIQMNASAQVNIIFELPVGGYWEMPSPIYTGGLWLNPPLAGNGGQVQVTEIT